MCKRTLRGVSYLSCDYTGFPMKHWACYHQSKALGKRSHYCNWEAAAADAARLLKSQQLPRAEYDEVMKNILVKTSGVLPAPPPSAKELKHLFTAGSIGSLEQFQEACRSAPYDVTVLKISWDGDLSEHKLTCAGGELPVHTLMTRFESAQAPSQYAHERTIRYRSRQLLVFYMVQDDLSCRLNERATRLLGKNLYGDVVLVQSAREDAEPSPRTRYAHYTLHNLHAEFRRERQPRYSPEVLCELPQYVAINEAMVDGMAPDDYEVVRREMQDALSAFEARASEAALPPAEYSRKARRASKSGPELAALARRKRARPAATGCPATGTAPATAD